MYGSLDSWKCARRSVASLALAAVVAAGVARPAAALVTPLRNSSSVIAAAAVGGDEDIQSDSNSGGGLNWTSYALAQKFRADLGTSALCETAITSEMSDSLLRGECMGWISGGGLAAWTTMGTAQLILAFRVSRTQNFTFDVASLRGAAPNGFASFAIRSIEQPGLAPLIDVPNPGLNTESYGRLSPGRYELLGTCTHGGASPVGDAPYLFVEMRFADCVSPLLQRQPTSITVIQGLDASFTVGSGGSGMSATSVSGSPISYQWRRDGVNLADGGRISGATTDHLVISSSVPADSGWYDVVATQDTIVEPSSLARLRVMPGTDGVETPGSAAALALEAPSPNPFAGRTSLRFTLPAESDASVAVYDVNGRLVRSLLGPTRLPGGLHTAAWDGTAANGRRVDAGVYFVRLQAGAETRVRRVVSLSATR